MDMNEKMLPSYIVLPIAAEIYIDSDPMEYNMEDEISYGKRTIEASPWRGFYRSGLKKSCR